MKEIIAEKKRKINLDVYRVLLMFFIVIHHSIIYGLNLSDLSSSSYITSSISKYLILIDSIVIVGVNGFWIISGFFLIKYKRNKVISLYLEMMFYVFLGIIIYGFLGNGWSVSSVLKILLPFECYWFMLVYLGLYLVSPFINMILNKINEKELNKYLLFTSIIVFYFGFIRNKAFLGFNGGYSLVQAIYMYFIGYYISVKKNKIKINKYLSLFAFCIIALINTTIILVLLKYNKQSLCWKLLSYNNPLIIIQSILLFLFFSHIKLNCRYNNSIYYISSSTLAVYLITESPGLSQLIYIPMKYFNFSIISIGIIQTILYSILLFLISIFIDFSRRLIVKSYYKSFGENIKLYKKKRGFYES